MKRIKYKNPIGDYIIDCYGVLTDDCNIVAKSSHDERYIENWNDDTNQPFKYWQEVVEYLLDSSDYDDLQELEAHL